MELLFLGTGGSVPTPERNTTALAIRHGPEVLLFDCGEGTQRQFMRSSFSYMKVGRIFISHLHGDHFLGLPGLVQSMNFNGRERPLSIYGPEGTKDMVAAVLGLGYYDLGFEVRAEELTEGQKVDGADYAIQAVEVEHTVPALGFILQEKPSPGRFLPERARALGVPEGPLFARLQSGHSIAVGGEEIAPEAVMGPSRPGLKVAYSGDTRPCQRFLEAARGSDILVHEATVDSSLAEKAKAFGHSTAAEAGRLAFEAGVKRLFLIHFSGRYEDPTLLLEEARAQFPESYLAVDLLQVDVRQH